MKLSCSGGPQSSSAVRSLVGNARNGRGGALLITASRDREDRAARCSHGAGPGMQVLRVDGYEAESTIPFAAVQRLAIPLRDHLAVAARASPAGAPGRGRRREGPPPDRFLVGLGVLGLLAAAARGRAGGVCGR